MGEILINFDPYSEEKITYFESPKVELENRLKLFMESRLIIQRELTGFLLPFSKIDRTTRKRVFSSFKKCLERKWCVQYYSNTTHSIPAAPAWQLSLFGYYIIKVQVDVKFNSVWCSIPGAFTFRLNFQYFQQNCSSSQANVC